MTFLKPTILNENAPSTPTSSEPSSTDAASDIIPERKKYYERHYLLYGGMYEPKCLAPDETKAFLKDMGFGNSNPLSQARQGRDISVALSASYRPDKRNVRYCDFCGCEIYGVEYETLADGRDRCMQCSKTSIKTGEEFKEIFENVRHNMEAFFGIRLNVGVMVKMVNSRTLHKELGHSFTPTPKQDGRVLGVAIRHRDGSFSLLIENGSPRMASIMTMAHELTHIWQYLYWNERKIRRKYGRRMELEIYEGMAKWVEVQYAYLINEPALAKRTEIITSYRDDEYGRGFLRYCANYPFSMGTYITKNTPFMFPEQPLDPEFCGAISVITPGDDTVGLPTDDDDTPTGGSDTPRRTPAGISKGTDLYGPAERDPENPPLYARSLLSPEEQEVYDIFLDALQSFKPSIPSLAIPMTPENVFDMFEKVLIDHPEIFWFRGNETCMTNAKTNLVEEVRLSFRYTKEEADKATDEIMATIQPFFDSIDDSMSDFEVVLRAYETLVNFVDYDTVALDQQNKIPASEIRNKPDPIRTIYGVFVDKKAVCAGYARAFQFLLKVMGMEAAFVSSGDHAWNLVKLEGDYYHLDATWADNSDTSRENTEGNLIDYSFFCVTTEEILMLDAHTPLSILPLPKCTATKCNFHHRFGLYFDRYNEAEIRNAVVKSIVRDQKTITFKFANIDARNVALQELHYNGKIQEILRFAATKTGICMDLDYICTAPKDRPVLNFYSKQI